ncbi:hypothetical protein CY0110_20012 [Crocosphaera chwakensis CCY0110]|uniref:Uncharacterized protein n=1 Tax=Crocosphaera chwakensis CCY0110 TaxID=391612 RepID=A3IJY4_9CHRO|nr:hypothetical protein CY0110_20012 [Crocosphaera chwakensis CCY0110]
MSFKLFLDHFFSFLNRCFVR